MLAPEVKASDQHVEPFGKFRQVRRRFLHTGCRLIGLARRLRDVADISRDVHGPLRGLTDIARDLLVAAVCSSIELAIVFWMSLMRPMTLVISLIAVTVPPTTGSPLPWKGGV